MSEEQFKIWKQVEAKGLEKLEKVEKVLASTEKEGFNFDFAHDFIGIQKNIVREHFPAVDFGNFVPRFAGK